MKVVFWFLSSQFRVFLVLQRKGIENQNMPPKNKSLWLKYYFELMKITEKQQKAIKALCPSPTCLKESCDYLAGDSYQPKDKIYITSLIKQTLSSISFPHIYHPKFCHFWKPEIFFLCLVNSLEIYFSLLRCYISPSLTTPLSSSSHMCTPHVLINYLFFSY